MKNKALKILMISIFSTSVSFSTYSCSNLPNSNTSTGDRAVGSKVDAKYVIDFFPQFAAGMKLTYLTKSKVGQVDMSQQLLIEVTEVNNNIAQLRVNSGTSSNIVPFDSSKPPILPDSGITYEGLENITVGAGSYNNATKVSFSNTTSVFNAWLIKDIGILKVVEQKKDNSLIITTELTEFKK